MANTVIVTEPSQTMRRIVHMLLEPLDYRIREATSGAHTIKILEQEGGQLVIVNEQVDDQSGTVLCQELRRRGDFRGLKILVLRGINSELDPQAARMAGADEVIDKPFLSEQFLTCVQRLLKTPVVEPKQVGSNPVNTFRQPTLSPGAKPLTSVSGNPFDQTPKAPSIANPFMPASKATQSTNHFKLRNPARTGAPSNPFKPSEAPFNRHTTFPQAIPSSIPKPMSGALHTSHTSPTLPTSPPTILRPSSSPAIPRLKAPSISMPSNRFSTLTPSPKEAAFHSNRELIPLIRDVCNEVLAERLPALMMQGLDHMMQAHLPELIQSILEHILPQIVDVVIQRVHLHLREEDK